MPRGLPEALRMAVEAVIGELVSASYSLYAEEYREILSFKALKGDAGTGNFR
jgi:hypothetical protein